MNRHTTDGGRARTLDELAGLLETYLIEQPFPQNLLAHAAYYFTGRFHHSLLALQLLIRSGYPAEARTVMRMLVEYTVTLKFIAKQPDERAARFIEEADTLEQDHEFHMQHMAEETKSLDWYHSVYQPYTSAITPCLGRELDELFAANIQDTTDSEELLALSYELAAEFLDCIRSI